MTTSIYLPYHDLKLTHQEQISVAPRKLKSKFDKWLITRDGEAPPINLSDFSLSWLKDFLRDGWDIYIRNPFAEAMMKGAILLAARPGSPLPGLTGLNNNSLPGLIGPENSKVPSPLFVITSWTSGTNSYTNPDDYKMGQFVGVGGGGGGGTVNATGTIGGSGGGGGGCFSKTFLISGVGRWSITIGAGGAARSGYDLDGNSGGTTSITGSFLSSSLSATGGTGGRAVNGAGGTASGGTGSGGDANYTGGSGGTAVNNLFCKGGGGAAGPTGNGGAGVTGNGGYSPDASQNGTGTGGGGGTGFGSGVSSFGGHGSGGGGVNQTGGFCSGTTNPNMNPGGNPGGDAAFIPPSGTGGNQHPNGSVSGDGGLGGGGGGGSTSSTGWSGGSGTAALFLAA